MDDDSGKWSDHCFPAFFEYIYYPLCLLISVILFIFKHNIYGIWSLEFLEIKRLNSTQFQQISGSDTYDPLTPCYSVQCCDEVTNSWGFAIILGTVYFDLVTVYLLAIPSTVPLLTGELAANVTLCFLKLKPK